MKQAVVLIHGIGEQVPMDTLRGFVEAVWTTDSSLRRPNVPSQAWSKPDEVSGDFELRRLTTAENLNRKRTDFFEFYWAHLMEGTTLSHVGAWARVLIFRWPRRVPPQLLGVWCLLIALLALGAAAGLNHVFKWVLIPSALVTLGWAAWFLLGSSLVGLLINVAGDAARYLHVAPPNIEIRRRIREAGIQLIQQLHSSSEYDRIIVVGHSLGSVIGYDILTHLWTRYHDVHVAVAGNPVAYPAMDALEALAGQTLAGNLNANLYQAAQSTYLAELQNQGNKWLITDFVTLGSPLAHATVLMAQNSNEFMRKKSEREFPTCPPVLEEMTVNKAKEKKFAFKSGAVWVPHHAAVFAPTRWTNLYFPCRWTVWGDLIGGPVAPWFGPGIQDIEVETNLRCGIFSHTLYWSFPKNRAGGATPSWIDSLRKAVRICETPIPVQSAPATAPV
jgi:hypothetical protein